MCPPNINHVVFSNCYAREAAHAGFSCPYSNQIKSLLYGCLAEECNYGFDYCGNLTSCRVDSCYYGFYFCNNLSSCFAYSGEYGFYWCTNIAASRAMGCSGSCFRDSDRISGCQADGNSVSHYGFDGCGYVAASYAINCTISGWGGCTKIDNDSCNNL